MQKMLWVPTPVPLALTIPLHEAGGSQGLAAKDPNLLALNESSLNPGSIELRGPPWESAHEGTRELSTFPTPPGITT